MYPYWELPKSHTESWSLWLFRALGFPEYKGSVYPKQHPRRLQCRLHTEDASSFVSWVSSDCWLLCPGHGGPKASVGPLESA